MVKAKKLLPLKLWWKRCLRPSKKRIKMIFKVLQVFLFIIVGGYKCIFWENSECFGQEEYYFEELSLTTFLSLSLSPFPFPLPLSLLSLKLTRFNALFIYCVLFWLSQFGYFLAPGTPFAMHPISLSLFHTLRNPLKVKRRC